MFVNCSNHPSGSWGTEQRTAAEKWGTVVDYPFPNVKADDDAKRIINLAEAMAAEIALMRPDCVMCQGEYSLTYALVNKLKERGLYVVCACSERRLVTELAEENTVKKTSIFQFVQFREYK